jgi:hypothetical protein
MGFDHKEGGLKVNVDKTVTTGININVKINVNVEMVREVDRGRKVRAETRNEIRRENRVT